MAEIKQWVNLTVNERWKGEELDSLDCMGYLVNLKIEFAKKQRATAWVTQEADRQNAAYSPREKRRRLGFRPNEFRGRRISSNRNGIAILRTRVTLAGGDKFTIKVKDKKGKELQADDILARRKLYYQVIKMSGVTGVGSAQTQDVEAEFWNPSKNLYIKLVEFAPGRTIPSRPNYNDMDSVVKQQILQQTRAQVDRSKRPYSFIVLVVRGNAFTKDRTGADPANVTPGTPVPISVAPDTLGDALDPNDNFYKSVEWHPASGSPVTVPGSAVTPAGPNTFNIDTTGLPPGPGVFQWKVMVFEGIGRGLAEPSDNFTLVATEDPFTGNPLPGPEWTMTHEFGHKIGMVPSGNGALDPQDTHYDNTKGHWGDHCYHGASSTVVNYQTTNPLNPAPDCTMFGDDRTQTKEFCEECVESVRKADIRSRTNPGIRNQF